ncbi:deoxynucleoside kinase [Patescibacteria group bacterium]|nr:deoxynucleoside kinase [Patescibacteria group bacterium]MBU4453017.1 deoxynucleoside kinase [Patescibacteria group bacterium]MCG2687822.1 deoxynucleoside kinase [Candidatus Parcubacteria bacterium]
MRHDTGQFIVFDGIAGSGKSTLIKALKEHFAKQGKRIFDLSEWTKDHHEPPRFEDIANFDIYFTFEPTKYWVGSAIRFELSHENYSGLVHAHAFSLDRQIQYNRLIIPALVAGKTIIQDRSVSSSIVYQPIMEGGPKLEELIKLPGNTLALEFAPNHIIVTNIDAHKLVDRFKRDDDSKGLYENIEYLQQVNKRFESNWFSELFTNNGTCVHHFSTDLEIENMKQNIINLITSILK